jgi:hypothetical protein
MQDCKWESGTVYGTLTCTGKSYKDEKKRYIEVLCKCGVVKFMRMDTVRRNPTVSCGCSHSERLKVNKPAVTHGLRKHPLYLVHAAMKRRCYNPNDGAFKSYGMKGVSVCSQWKDDFKVFYDWAIANGWQEGLQLDKDILYNKKHGTKTGMIYSPEYCCFVTPKVNSRNRNTSRFLEYKGQLKTSAEWAEEVGLTQQQISRRLNEFQWSIEKTLSTQ